jgi:hypothetical protein
MHPLPRHETAGFEEVLRTVALSLGQDRYEQAHQVGATMPYPAVVALAANPTPPCVRPRANPTASGTLAACVQLLSP